MDEEIFFASVVLDMTERELEVLSTALEEGCNEIEYDNC